MLSSQDSWPPHLPLPLIWATPLLWSLFGLEKIRVNPRFHPTSVWWNLGLTRKFLALALCMGWKFSMFIQDFSIPKYGEMWAKHGHWAAGDDDMYCVTGVTVYIWMTVKTGGNDRCLCVCVSWVTLYLYIIACYLSRREWGWGLFRSVEPIYERELPWIKETVACSL